MIWILRKQWGEAAIAMLIMILSFLSTDMNLECEFGIHKSKKIWVSARSSI